MCHLIPATSPPRYFRSIFPNSKGSPAAKRYAIPTPLLLVIGDAIRPFGKGRAIFILLEPSPLFLIETAHSSVYLYIIL